jgi:hypothetical protein
VRLVGTLDHGGGDAFAACRPEGSVSTMKKLTVLGAGLMLALSLTVVAGAIPPPQATGGVDYARYGKYAHASFVAQDTHPARGQLDVVVYNDAAHTSVNQWFHAVVTCYAFVSPNKVYFTGDITESSPTTNWYVRAVAIDNGQGDNASAPDQFEFERNGTDPSGDDNCSQKGPPLNITDGNVQVFPPAP